ncbi:MAG: phytanoyl-CoA dioxygenase family protein [Deferribacteres bacterium]|nr:phytanoyl-CoA dioxygenase family protein [candidate division KSB1 bacterium]MCB9501661.1 phytanoyl-CoA dioxygenase family protein [Deferribacteres bacterium]
MNKPNNVINEPFGLASQDIDFFRENGFVKLAKVLPAEVLQFYGEEITAKVMQLNTMHLPMKERTTYKKAFLQIANIWKQSEIAKEFVFGTRLARIAAELMGTTGVRLYHDQALYKEPTGGATPWHVDQFYWPLASEKCVTAWIPLQDTPLEMGPLAFAAKSQNYPVGRDLPISDESETKLKISLKEGNFEHWQQPFNLGDVSFHYGWTFHHAGGNSTEQMRKVMTVIYMDEHMRLQNPANKNQQIDWDVRCPGAKIGEIIDTELNPVLYSKTV